MTFKYKIQLHSIHLKWLDARIAPQSSDALCVTFFFNLQREFNAYFKAPIYCNAILNVYETNLSSLNFLFCATFTLLTVFLKCHSLLFFKSKKNSRLFAIFLTFYLWWEIFGFPKLNFMTFKCSSGQLAREIFVRNSI